MTNYTTIEKNRFGTLGSRTKGDKVIWATVVMLALVSLLAVYSSTGLLAYKMYKGNTEVYLFKQFAFIMVGILIYLFRSPGQLYHCIQEVARILFILSIPLLVYTLFFGVKTEMKRGRWIRLPIINLTFQTSEPRQAGDCSCISAGC